MSRNLKEIVSNDATVEFSHFRRGNLYYRTADGFCFPVPTEDAGDASFHKIERAMLMMRYIRKAIDDEKTEAEMTEEEQIKAMAENGQLVSGLT